MKQLKPFPIQLHHERQARDITTRSPEVGDPAPRYGIVADSNHNGNCARRLLGRWNTLPVCHNDLDFEADQLGHEIRKPVESAPSESILMLRPSS